MLAIPAIDLKDKKCVRLEQGMMDKATIFSKDPVKIAERWVGMGCSRLHLVDLDGAFAGEPINDKVIESIVKRFPDVRIQVGGGIRTLETAKRYIDLGVSYIIVGTKAVLSPDFITQLCDKFPSNIIIGVDAKKGMVATQGWANVSSIKAIDLIRQFSDLDIDSIIYTDIAKDGMMQGVNIAETSELANSTPIPVIASGGVSTIEDLVGLQSSSPNIFGAIIGRAIYDGTIDLKKVYEKFTAR